MATEPQQAGPPRVVVLAEYEQPPRHEAPPELRGLAVRGCRDRWEAGSGTAPRGDDA